MGYFSHGTVPVTTTASLIGSFPINEPEGPGALIKNVGPVTVFLGDNNVTAALGTTGVPDSGEGGFPLEPGETLLLPASGSTRWDLYGITATDTAFVSYLGA